MSAMAVDGLEVWNHRTSSPERQTLPLEIECFETYYGNYQKPNAIFL